MSAFATLAVLYLLSLALIGLFIMYLVSIYNQLVRKKNQVDQAFSSIDVLLKKRCDLIPNLVATVKNYMKYEQKTLAQVTRLRSQVISSDISNEEKLRLEQQISRHLGNIINTIENYPELKANRNVSQLQSTLLEVEEQISAARRFYNSAVTEYNNAIEIFPNSLIAAKFNFQPTTVFRATEQDRQNVNVGQLFEM